ncbi:MAG TPA: hypothetical protein VNG33_18410 [Polyangiaceae bacterium]|nr:hypothetical protein [Polyangiaceae bacterium]
MRIVQIWFDDASRQNCFDDPAVTLRHNQERTHYWENQVILELAPYTAEHVGVWSHAALRKIQRDGTRDFSLEVLKRICEVGGFDVLGFHHVLRRQVILDDSVKVRFDAMFDYLMRQLGVDFSSRIHPRFNILQNHFIATREVMNDYCKFLKKAVSVMEGDERLKQELWQRAPYKLDSGIHYTYHPFICERLISAYLHLNPELRCRYYKYRAAGLARAASAAQRK